MTKLLSCDLLNCCMGECCCFEGNLPWGVSRDVVAVLGIGVWLGLGVMRVWECAQSWE